MNDSKQWGELEELHKLVVDKLMNAIRNLPYDEVSPLIGNAIKILQANDVTVSPERMGELELLRGEVESIEDVLSECQG